MAQLKVSAALILVLIIVGVTGTMERCLAEEQSGAAAVAASPFPGISPNASAVPGAAPLNCTPQRTFEDTLQPFCFIPETVSPQAAQYLSHMAAGQMFSSGDFVNNRTVLEQTRRYIQEMSTNRSNEIVAALFRELRNDTIGGVPVVFGVPKGVPSSKPEDTMLLLYLHGGEHKTYILAHAGFFSGSCQYQWSIAAPVAAKTDLTALCIEYALAPEHPFPAGLNQILNVYKKLLEQGYQANNIVIMGDSAGGGLVASTAIQLQREKLPLPAALGMMSPYSEAETKLDSVATMIGIDPMLPGETPDSSNGMNLAYVGGNASLMSDPLVSPRREDFAKLFPNGIIPPTLIQVGLREVLLSHAVLLYHKMKEAAPNPTRVLISPYDAMWHVFQMFESPEAEKAINEMSEFFARSMNGTLCQN